MVDTLFDVLTFLGLILAGIFIWAAFSPFEALGWWAGWFGDKIYEEEVPSDGLLRRVQPHAQGFIIFLSGVGSTSGETLSYRERTFLERLARALPRLVLIDDVFPYSVNNLALTRQPIFARLWRWALKWKMDGPRIAGNLINLRNIFRICMSIDRRYGPMYNQGVAEVLLHGLLRYNYNPHGDVPVILVASSGAAQIAIGAVTYLKEWIQAPVYVISIGGVFGSDPGLLVVDHMYHLYGARDTAVKWSMLDAGRWSVYASSAWNRARRQDRVTEIQMGNMCHSGRGGYLDFRHRLPDGRTYVDKTVDTVAEIVTHVIGPSADTAGDAGTQPGAPDPVDTLASPASPVRAA